MDDFFRDKTEVAIERIRAFCPPEGYYVAFSGGKDSVVTLDLVKRAGVPFDAHYNSTTVDPPELVRFIRTFPEVKIEKPKITMWKLIPLKRMPPTRIARYCCAYLKETGGADRRVLTGVRKEESVRRAKRRMVEACYRDSRRTYIHPIIDWTTVEVWTYIRGRNLQYCLLYDEGFKRIGCIGCPMGGRENMLKQFARWPTYKKAYIKAFQRLIDKRKADGLPTTGWGDGEQLFEWWVSDRRGKKEDENQEMLIFE